MRQLYLPIEVKPMSHDHHLVCIPHVPQIAQLLNASQQTSEHDAAKYYTMAEGVAHVDAALAFLNVVHSLDNI